MRIMIIGAGAVGFHRARRLSEEHQDVVVILRSFGRAGDVGGERVVRDAMFQVVSIGTTTGFVT